MDMERHPTKLHVAWLGWTITVHALSCGHLEAASATRHPGWSRIAGSTSVREIRRGPCVTNWLNVGKYDFQFAPNSKELLFRAMPDLAGTTIEASAINAPTNRSPIAHFDGYCSVHFIGNNLSSGLVVEEGLPQVKGVSSTENPRRHWFVNGKTRNKRQLLKNWNGQPCWVKSISPDKSTVVLGYWKDRHAGHTRGLILVNLETDTFVQVERDNAVLELSGWWTNQSKLVGLVSSGTLLHANKLFFLHLPDGRLTPAPPEVRAPDPELLVSPDGRHTATMVRREKLILTCVESRESAQFRFMPAESKAIFSDKSAYAFAWVSPRYIEFIRDPPALIDIETLDMIPITAPNDAVNVHSFSPDFSHARGLNRDGHYLGKVSLAAD